MTPTPTLTPIPILVPVWYSDLQLGAPVMAAAIWAVLILFLFVLVVRPRQKVIQTFEVVALVALPLALLNAAVWAFTVYLFVVIYSILYSVGRIAE